MDSIRAGENIPCGAEVRLGGDGQVVRVHEEPSSRVVNCARCGRTLGEIAPPRLPHPGFREQVAAACPRTTNAPSTEVDGAYR